MRSGVITEDPAEDDKRKMDVLVTRPAPTMKRYDRSSVSTYQPGRSDVC